MIKAKVREKYEGLSRQELLDKAYELGFNYDKNSQACSQALVAAFHELLGVDPNVVRVATSSCAGQAAQVEGTCGLLIGGTMVLDYFLGRPAEKMSYQERIPANLKPAWDAIEAAKLLYDKFVKEFGSIICPHIQRQVLGRPYYFPVPDEFKKFEKIGGHTVLGPAFCGKATRGTKVPLSHSPDKMSFYLQFYSQCSATCEGTHSTSFDRT